MKDFLKKFLVIFTMLFSILGVTSLATTASVHAANSRKFGNCDLTLGLKPWDCGVIEKPTSDEELMNNFIQIASNISYDIGAIAGYLAVGYVIYGGYLYMTASGDPNKAAAGKRTLTHAFIGLAIVGLVDVILKSIHFALLGTAGAFDGGADAAVSAESVVHQMIGWVIGIAGIVCAAYVVIGGIGYVTSAGDPSKLQKAKSTILYALIGLAICGLSLVITNFVINAILSADAAGSSGKNGGFATAIQTLLSSVIAVAGVVSVAFIIVGGTRYMTSAGDPSKTKKAKDTLLYACIGLVVCALAFAIVNFAIGVINDSGSDSSDTSLHENPIAFLEEKL